MGSTRILRHAAVTASLMSIAATCFAGDDGPTHVFYIAMENHGYAEVIGNPQMPFTNSLARKYAVATHYFGVTHPSLPNYLAMVSGSSHQIFDDCSAVKPIPSTTPSLCAPEEFWPADIVAANGPNDATDADPMTDAQYQASSITPHVLQGETLVDQLKLAGRSWKGYMQGLPASPTLHNGTITNEVEYAPGTVQDSQGNPVLVKQYAEKHNPFLYFANIRADQSQLSRIVPFDGLANDLASRHVPSFSFIVPDQCSDMHGVSTAATSWLTAHGHPEYQGCDTDIAGPGAPLPSTPNVFTIGDAFLQRTVTAIQSSPVWRHGRNYIVIVWDEDDYSGFAGCCGSPKNTETGAVLGGAQVPAIVISNHPQHDHTHPRKANHISMLGALQTLWDLPCLGETCNPYNRRALLPLFD